MTVEEVVQYWRMLTQEPDDSFITDANVTLILKNSYREFRKTVGMYSDTYFNTTASLPVSGGSYNLALGAVSVMGATPTNARLRRIISLADVDTASPGFGAIYQGVSTRRSLFAGNNSTASMYYLEGEILWFDSTNTGGNLLLTYEPVESVDWTVLNAATWIDNLDEFHDLIALYGARRYMAIDAASAQEMITEIKIREADIQDYFGGMVTVDNRMIQREEAYEDGGSW